MNFAFDAYFSGLGDRVSPGRPRRSAANGRAEVAAYKNGRDSVHFDYDVIAQ